MAKKHRLLLLKQFMAKNRKQGSSAPFPKVTGHIQHAGKKLHPTLKASSTKGASASSGKKQVP